MCVCVCVLQFQFTYIYVHLQYIQIAAITKLLCVHMTCATPSVLALLTNPCEDILSLLPFLADSINGWETRFRVYWRESLPTKFSSCRTIYQPSKKNRGEEKIICTHYIIIFCLAFKLLKFCTVPCIDFFYAYHTPCALCLNVLLAFYFVNQKNFEDVATELGQPDFMDSLTVALHHVRYTLSITLAHIPHMVKHFGRFFQDKYIHTYLCVSLQFPGSDGLPYTGTRLDYTLTCMFTVCMLYPMSMLCTCMCIHYFHWTRFRDGCCSFQPDILHWSPLSQRQFPVVLSLILPSSPAFIFFPTFIPWARYCVCPTSCLIPNKSIMTILKSLFKA